MTYNCEEELFSRKLKGHIGFTIDINIFKGISYYPREIVRLDSIRIYEIRGTEVHSLYCLWQTPELQLLEVLCAHIDYVHFDNKVIDIHNKNKSSMYILTTRDGELVRYVFDRFLNRVTVVDLQKIINQNFPELLDDFVRATNDE